MASGSDVRAAYVAESTFGTTPATPSFKTMRVTSGGLRTVKQTQKSDEIRNDYNVVDEIQVGQDVNGSYPFELSYGSFDDIMEAALGGTWATNVLKNGTVKRFFTFEEMIELGDTDSFKRFSGCMINGFALSLSAREKITGSFDIVGKQETLATAAVAGATYAAVNTETIMVAGTSVGSIALGELSGLCVASLSLNVSRNLRPVYCVGGIYANSMNYGDCDVTGEAEVYFKDNEAYQAALDHGVAAITATIGHDDDKKYTISIPRARWLSAEAVIGGKDSDLMVKMPFRGTFSTDHSIQITRAVA